MNEYLITIAGTAIIYVFLIAGLLIFGKKELAQLSITELVFILLISNAVQNAMVNGDWKSLWMGMIAACTLFAMRYGLKQLALISPFFNNLIEGKPVVLIRDGTVLEENIKQEEISMKELEAMVREHGVEKISEVSLAVLEADGNISVISFNNDKKTIIKRKGKKTPPRVRRQK